MRRVLIIYCLFVFGKFEVVAQSPGETDSVGYILKNRMPPCFVVNEARPSIQGVDSNKTKIRLICPVTSYQSGQLLFVVDGIPFDEANLPNLTPGDIESIIILKDTDIGQLCCNRLLGGVIIIQTKQSIVRQFVIKDFQNGAFISRATISFVSSDKKDSLITKTNDSGIVITYKLKPGKTYDVKVSSVGYKNLSIFFHNKDFIGSKEFLLEKDFKKCSEAVIVVPNIGRRISCGPKITHSRDSIEETNGSISFFKLFPNPAQSGGNINIEWKQSETGYFILELFNQAGQMILTKELWIDDKATVLNFELPHVASGNYIVRMTSKQSGKAFSEKIIIQ